MDVSNLIVKNGKTLKNLNNGDVFRYEDMICIKTDELSPNNEIYYVDLEDGCLDDDMDANTIVEVLNVKLVNE